MSHKPHVHLIACGVLAADTEPLARKLDLHITTEYLPGGLHESPTELRLRLQEAIDQASSGENPDRIAIGYGLCGRGTVGLHARQVPLLIPKVHDCIALFLGSDAEYKRQFASCPGTYYISAGWYDEKVQPKSQQATEPGAAKARPRGDYAQLAAQYGPEQADAICEFMNSWQRNYRRAAFIDTGAPGRKKYADHAKAMADAFGWEYAEIPGRVDLLEELLTAPAATERVALIPPGQVTVHDALAGISAAPPSEGAKRPAAVLGSSEPDRPAAEAQAPAVAPLSAGMAGGGAGIGLGIDAGGTYTDAVVFDFAASEVLAKAKAPTTRWDFTIGIAEALAQLPQEMLPQVSLVSISTTLATNAIVEGEGQSVGLILMPPPGFDPSAIQHAPTATVAGRLDIAGSELQRVDPAAAAEVARRMVERSGVGAFAVSGYAGAINPAHELAVKQAIVEATGRSVTCGHELSDLLDYRARAHTAVLNARIIPRLARFIDQAGLALQQRGIDARVMVVKGDGSLMSTDTAREKPVETALSGPAASVAGARYLTGRSDATVVDIGGTTTDTATLAGGRVATCGAGATVGGWKTHVRALDMRTVGLGGDSLLALKDRRLTIGPARVAPVAWAGQHAKGIEAALAFLAGTLDDYSADTRGMELLVATGSAEGEDLSEGERTILRLLAERPHSLAELARRGAAGHWSLLRTDRLVQRHLVQPAGPTPTDLLHVTGQFARWNAKAAGRHAALLADLAGRDLDDFAEAVLSEFVRRLARELLLKQLGGEDPHAAAEECPTCSALLDGLLSPRGDRGWGARLELRDPVIGIGAPVHFFLPRAGRMLGAEVIIPADADVANAVGAVTSEVIVTRTVRIRPDEAGQYKIEGLADGGTFNDLAEAEGHARQQLDAHIRQVARQAGTDAEDVHWACEDRVAHSSDGTELFLERAMTASVSGRPAATVAQPAPGRASMR